MTCVINNSVSHSARPEITQQPLICRLPAFQHAAKSSTSLAADSDGLSVVMQMWMAWPFALYMGERIYGLFRARSWDTQVMGASILDPGVLTLELAKPPGFSYMYMLLNAAQMLHKMCSFDEIHSIVLKHEL